MTMTYIAPDEDALNDEKLRATWDNSSLESIREALLSEPTEIFAVAVPTNPSSNVGNESLSIVKVSVTYIDAMLTDDDHEGSNSVDSIGSSSMPSSKESQRIKMMHLGIGICCFTGFVLFWFFWVRKKIRHSDYSSASPCGSRHQENDHTADVLGSFPFTETEPPDLEEIGDSVAIMPQFVHSPPTSECCSVSSSTNFDPHDDNHYNQKASKTSLAQIAFPTWFLRRTNKDEPRGNSGVDESISEQTSNEGKDNA